MSKYISLPISLDGRHDCGLCIQIPPQLFRLLIFPGTSHASTTLAYQILSTSMELWHLSLSGTSESNCRRRAVCETNWNDCTLTMYNLRNTSIEFCGARNCMKFKPFRRCRSTHSTATKKKKKIWTDKKKKNWKYHICITLKNMQNQFRSNLKQFCRGNDLSNVTISHKLWKPAE